MRVGIFIFLGPVLGLLVLIALGGGFRSHAGTAFAVVLPFAILAGFLPALIVAGFDRFLERSGVRSIQRYLGAALCGYVAAYLLMFANLFESSPLVPYELKWGLIGMIPAIICSWVADMLSGFLPED